MSHILSVILLVFMLFTNENVCQTHNLNRSPSVRASFYHSGLWPGNPSKVQEKLEVPLEDICNNPKIAGDKLCLKENCIHLSSRILSKLDQSVDPCHDFFKFSCGKWQKSNAHQIDDDNLFYASNLNEMPDEVDTVLRALLTGSLKIYEDFYTSKPFRDVHLFYSSCMDIEQINKEGFAPAVLLLKSLQEFYVGKPFDKESFNLTKAVLELLLHNGVPLFDITLDASLVDSSKWGVIVSSPRHFGLIPNLIGSSFRRGKRPGFPERFRHNGRKLLKKIIKEMENDLFILELLADIEKGIWPSSKEKLSAYLSESQKIDGSTPVNHQHRKRNNHLSFYSKIIENESINYIKDKLDENKSDKENSAQYTNDNKFDANHMASQSSLSDYYDSSMNDMINSADNTEDVNMYDYYFPTVFFNNMSNINNTDNVMLLHTNNISSHSSNNNIQDINSLILNSTLLQNIKNAIAKNFSENDPPHPDVFTNIIVPAIFQTISNSNDTLANQFHNIFGNNTGTALPFEDGDSKKQAAAMELLQMLGLIPKISRKDLYDEIQKEVKVSRSNQLSETLHKEEFHHLLSIVDAMIEANDSWQHVTIDNMEDAEKTRHEAFDQILDFVNELRELEPTEREDVLLLQHGEVFNPYTVVELQEAFPYIEWRYLLSSLLNMTVPDDETIIVYYKKYMTDLASLLQSKEPWVIHYGMLLLYVFDVISELTTVDNTEDREKFCFMAVKETLSDVMSHMYMHHVGEDKLAQLRNEITPITEALMAEALKTISRNTWMSPQDKEEASSKIATMDWQIGGLEEHFDLGYVEGIHDGVVIEDQHFMENVISLYKAFRESMYTFYKDPIDKSMLIWSFIAQPFTVNAFHLQSTNSIVLPEAFFRPPYFDYQSSAYINFGSTGMALAHEMVHALDFTGYLFDHKGNLTKPFSDEMERTMKEKINCFNNMVQTKFSEVTKVEGLQIFMEIDNNATMNENLADIVGLDLAYNAYIQQVNSRGHDDPLLPGIPLSRDQLFFIGFSQPYCAILPGLAKVILMEIDEHLPHDIRVNGLLVNSPNFTKAYNCSPGDRMYGSESNACPVFS